MLRKIIKVEILQESQETSIMEFILVKMQAYSIQTVNKKQLKKNILRKKSMVY